MITEFSISSNNELVVAATLNDPATSYEHGLLWYYDTYKDVAKSINIDSFVTANSGGLGSSSSNSEEISFTIPLTFLNLVDYTGIFYIQLFDNEVVSFDPLITPINNNLELAVAANLSKVYSCFINKLIETKVDNCNNIDKCGNVIYDLDAARINTLIEGVVKALIASEFIIANMFYTELLDICCNCGDCDTIVNTGYSIGTFNNIITIV